MTIAEGHFQLYAHLTPALPAGDWRLTASEQLQATGPHGALGTGELPVQDLPTHLRVTSPRFSLPPDQVLSTYPPANTEGAYGSRLPQVVIKRRTLPWERTVDPANKSDVDTEDTPWLALVVVAEGEADIVLNRPVAECVTPGISLDGDPDVAQGAYLGIRQSVVDAVLPTQFEVGLLAHARQVDINDTELMMGDDDGFLAVVVANRLPLAGRDEHGAEVPRKYLAALVNLEGQLHLLRKDTPAPLVFVPFPLIQTAIVTLTPAETDHVVMDSDVGVERFNEHVERAHGTAHAAGGPQAAGLGAAAVQAVQHTSDKVAGAATLREGWAVASKGVGDDIYATMASQFATYPSIVSLLDPELRFPVLLHWTFTSTGEVTFKSLMQGLDSGLLGTKPAAPQRESGRPPLEVVETGHVGIDLRTRVGDTVRSWYRGPLLPHPADTAADRLPLAHASDQLRTVVPDGREDLSLATAFEIGRLLALSQPAMVSALLRWRQQHYQTARTDAVLREAFAGLDLAGLVVDPDRLAGVALGRGLVRQIAAEPDAVLPPPLELHTAGTAMGLDLRAGSALTKGFGLPGLTGDMGTLLGVLRDTTVPRVDAGGLPGAGLPQLGKDALGLDHALVAGMLAADTLRLPGAVTGVGGIAGLAGLDVTVAPRGRGPRRAAPRDALDDLLDGADGADGAGKGEGDR